MPNFESKFAPKDKVSFTNTRIKSIVDDEFNVVRNCVVLCVKFDDTEIITYDLQSRLGHLFNDIKEENITYENT